VEPVRVGDRFQLQAEIGAGGMGTVYRALDTTTGQEVALKVLNENGGAAAERFTQEAVLLAELAHPAIVRYVDHGTMPGGEPYLAMEWLDGETLEERLARGPLGILDSVRLGRRVLEALAVAHRKGIVHRDIKPANIYLPARQLSQAKLLDFGVARRAFGSRRITMTTSSVGTPAYMSPEQVRGGREVDARSDLFSLGCVLYEALLGEPPFTGETDMAIAAKICLEDPVVVEVRRPDLPAPLTALLTRMLAKDPAQRPASAQELARELGELADALAQQGLVTGELSRVRLRRTDGRLATGEQRVISAIIVSHARGEISDYAVGVVQREVAPFGARADRFMTGALVISMVGEGTPTDQAAMAARCALTTRAVLPQGAFALCTGRVAAEGSLPLAELIERGFALVKGEEPGGIRLDDITAGLLESRFEIGNSGGKPPQRRLLFEKGLQEAPRTVLGREIPCVGREREIANLLGLWDQCTGEPVARAVLVTGAAGSGKSRVRHELLERIQRRGEPFALLIARGDSMRAGAPYALMAAALRAAFGVQGAEPLEVQRQQVLAHVQRHVSADKVRRVGAFLGEVAGVPFPDLDLPSLRAARLDPRLMADQTLTAWLDFIDAECAAHPVLLVFEDLHWGDAPSVQLVDAALRNLAERPLMVMAFSRPALEDRFPGLWNDRDLQRLSLAPLTPKSAQKIIRQIRPELSEERAAWIVERADGNPFYLEELVRAVGGDGADPEAPLPDTVIGMVQARLDAMGTEAKRALRAGAIFGQTFRAAGVRALIGDEDRSLDQWLDILAHKEVLFPRQVDGTREYGFRHALLQEAAYAMLNPADQTLGHRLAGQFLEASGERQSIILVEHYERGGEPARAAHFCLPATQQALDANDLPEVLKRAQRGARLGAVGAALGAMRLCEAQARFWRGEYAEAEVAAREAAANASPETRLSALSELATGLGQQSKFAELKALVAEVRAGPDRSRDSEGFFALLLKAAGYLVAAGEWEACRQLLDEASEEAGARSASLAQIRHKVRGFLELTLGHNQQALEEYGAALRLHEANDDVRGATEIGVNLALVQYECGAMAEGEAGLEASLVTSQRLGLGFLTGAVMVNLTEMKRCRGDLDGARKVGEQAVAMVSAQGDLRMEGLVLCYLSAVEHDARNYTRALARAERALAATEGVLSIKPLALAMVARAELGLGQVMEALEHARAGRALVPDEGDSQDQTTVRVVLIEALLVAGLLDDARREAAAARALLDRRMASIDNPTYRSRILADVPQYSRLISLGQQLDQIA
jgi:tetratricopeptide (TPR) repeat protein